MPRRSILERYIQVDVPPLIKKRILLGAEKFHGGNMSDYVRKWLYRGLLDDGLLTPDELATALSGVDLRNAKEKEECEQSV